ncbi:hypothetical protein J9303_11500 [Bacillaceae bacterium Marseille-Q3522]|nr:hypothetical protein [Bacillaceae bacterium Marseille-Q3522]
MKIFSMVILLVIYLSIGLYILFITELDAIIKLALFLLLLITVQGLRKTVKKLFF